MPLTVFIQNEAGSNRKNYPDEKTLEYKSSKLVSRPYPFPYGFIIGTAAADGLKLDCFVITSRPLKTGEIVSCEPIGLMEQIEDGLEDHNVLARLSGEDMSVRPEVEAVLADFVRNVFLHVAGKHVVVVKFFGVERALAHIAACRKHA